MNFTYIKTQPEVFKLLKTTEKVELFCTVCNETEVGIINNPSNILPLCPTCHWEFDNGFREEFKELLQNLNKTYASE